MTIQSFLRRLGVSVLALALCLVAWPADADAPIFPFKIHEKTLDNGLRVLVVPYDSPGVVAYFSVVRTGSREEVEPGHSGFAHFFEHMMFRGTDRYSSDDYNDVLKAMGADSNAFTSDDLTNYYIIGPANELGTMMDIESDRFKNLKYDENGFRTEALAVLGEYNKNVSNPFLPMFEKLRDLAFEKHTYKHTTMGFLDDIKAMPTYYDYSRKFFGDFYRPENVIVLVVGDADPAKTFAMAEKNYGDWEKGYKPAKIEVEPMQSEKKAGHIEWPSPTRPYMMMGYPVPAFDASSLDTAAFEVMSQVIFGETSELFQSLVVENQWADFIQGSADFHRDAYLFVIASRLRSNDLLPKVEKEIAEAIHRAQTTLVDPAELARIKSHLIYGFASGLNTPAGIGFTVSSFLSLDPDTSAINKVYAQLDKVKPEDIQRLAKQTFREDRQTVVTLAYPTPAPKADEAEAVEEEASR